jgi:hypothetical protein
MQISGLRNQSGNKPDLRASKQETVDLLLYSMGLAAISLKVSCYR